MSTLEAVEPYTLVGAWSRARRMFEAAGLETPVLDARLLLEAAAGVRRIEIVTDPHRPLASDQIGAFEALVARRLAREPVARIIGRKGFWTLDLEVTPDVLSPRPETELVVEAVLGQTGETSAFAVLDFGTGTGAILLSVLAARPNATGLGVDVSAAALAVAARNAERTGLAARAAWREARWGEGIEGDFDVIVSNPPYIATDALSGLAPEVRDYDPTLALDGGPDGLDAYRALAPHIGRLLADHGVAALEVGAGQAEAVEEILRLSGLNTRRILRDLSGHERVLLAEKPGRNEKVLGETGA